ncbi:MAG TPA: hypothetical protein DEA08_17060 [Planctomycetes bacterium]|nr:hypothetical protein [Planctomycetota bacterium]
MLQAVGDSSRERLLEICPFPGLLQVQREEARFDPPLGDEASTAERLERLSQRTQPLLPRLRELPLYFLAPPAPGTPIRLGSDARSCSICLPPEGVSALHAQVDRVKQRYRVVDLESRRGTYVEQRRAPVGVPLQLGGGQYLRMGDFVGLFLLPHQLAWLIERCRGAGREERFPATGASLNGLLSEGYRSGAAEARFLLQVPSQGSVADGLSSLELTTELSQSKILGQKRNRSAVDACLFCLERPHSRALSVGRQEGCDLVFKDASVSKRHARLRPHENGWRVIDLESANGTWLAERRLPAGVWTALPPTSTTLRFGSYSTVLLDGEELDSLLEHLAQNVRSRSS